MSDTSSMNIPSSSPEIRPISSQKIQLLLPSDPKQSPQARSVALTDLLAQPFAAFDHQAQVVGPFSEELARDGVFEQELATMLLELVLETHAWAAARVKHESNAAIQRYEKRISDLMDTEKEQEITREKLNDFVTKMKTALAALTGIGL